MMKKIDKKACRQFLEPLVPPAPDCGLFLVPKLKYIIRTNVKIIGHRRLLVLCLYARGDDASDGRPKLAYTMFQASDSFITYDHNPGRKTPWRTAMLENLECDYLFARNHCAFYSRSDEQRVLNFCKDHSGDGAYVLGRYQQHIRDAETKLRVRRRQKKVVEEFRCLRPLPKGVNDWLRRDVLPAYFFYDYHKGAKRVRGVCSACEQEFELEGVRHNTKGTCPRCGRKFTMKSNKKRGRLWDRETASVVQCLRENELVVRILKASRWQPREGSADLSFYEATRVVVRQTSKGKADVSPYHYDPYKAVLTPWKKGYPPVTYLYGQNYNAETCGYLYCENLSRELKGTPWEYCQLGAFYEGVQDQMEVTPYLSAYQEIPSIEFFVKLGLHWLAAAVAYGRNPEEIINPKGRNLREVLNIDPADLSYLQRPGASIRDLLLLRLQRTAGHQPSVELADLLRSNGVIEVEKLARALRYATPHKVMRYFEQQFSKMEPNSYRGHNGVVSDYDDYLGFCEQLQYDMKNEFVLFPKNLNAAHDQARALVKQEDARQYDPQIASIRKELKRRYQFSSDGLMVLPPQSAREIVVEGQKLHHCVGGYASSMARKECVILFVRQEEHKTEPFYTVEVKNNRVVQVRGAHNCAPTPEVRAFMEKWEQKKHLQRAA